MKPSLALWDDKRFWRGHQRQMARENLLDYIADMVVHYVNDDTPANRIRRQEMESIAKAIKRRRRARARK